MWLVKHNATEAYDVEVQIHLLLFAAHERDDSLYHFIPPGNEAVVPNAQGAGWVPEPLSSRWRSCKFSPYPECICEPCCQVGPRKIDNLILKRSIVTDIVFSVVA